MHRTIVKIDEEKCNGCGLCVPACAEGAIQIINGKAKLVSEIYCDGLGACLGECPQGAISMEQREAAEYDEEAVKKYLSRIAQKEKKAVKEPVKEQLPCGCPGSASRVIERSHQAHSSTGKTGTAHIESALGNWPVQIKLVPIQAPYFDKVKLLIAADCVPFAFADFHQKLLDGRTLLIGCPKLDDSEFYLKKLAEIFKRNEIDSIDVAYMEVPCCFGLVHIVKMALDEAGKNIPVTFTKLGIRGDVLEVIGDCVNVAAM